MHHKELLPPAYVVRREDTVFTGVCLSTGGEGQWSVRWGGGGSGPADGGGSGSADGEGGGQVQLMGGVRSSRWGGGSGPADGREVRSS